MTKLIAAILAKDKQLVTELLLQGEDATQDQPWMTAKIIKAEEIAALLPKAFDEYFILKFLKYLNYKFSNKGVCFGFAHMAKQAIAAGEIDIFNQRLIEIAELYFTLENQVLLNMSSLRKIVKRSDEDFQQALKTLFLQRLKLWQHSSDSKDRQKYIDIMAFFDGIFLYQKHPNRSRIFSHPHYYSNNHSAQETARILQSKKNITEYRGQLSGAYTREDLSLYLLTLENTCNQFKLLQPISFILTNHSHVMIISYDTLTKEWTYGDSNNMPLKKTNQINLLANKINSTLSNTDASIFTTSMYAAHEDRKNIECMMLSLSKNKEWQRIHTPTEDKLKLDSGIKKPCKWNTLASGKELQLIQKNYNHHHPFLKYFKFAANKLNKSVAKQTRGKFLQEYDEENHPIKLYQTTR